MLRLYPHPKKLVEITGLIYTLRLYPHPESPVEITGLIYSVYFRPTPPSSTSPTPGLWCLIRTGKHQTPRHTRHYWPYYQTQYISSDEALNRYKTTQHNHAEFLSGHFWLIAQLRLNIGPTSVSISAKRKQSLRFYKTFFVGLWTTMNCFEKQENNRG